MIGSGTADAQGEFQITLSPALKEAQKGTVVVEDAAGNVSKPVEITPDLTRLHQINRLFKLIQMVLL